MEPSENVYGFPLFAEDVLRRFSHEPKVSLGSTAQGSRCLRESGCGAEALFVNNDEMLNELVMKSQLVEDMWRMVTHSSCYLFCVANMLAAMIVRLVSCFSVLRKKVYFLLLKGGKLSPLKQRLSGSRSGISSFQLISVWEINMCSQIPW